MNDSKELITMYSVTVVLCMVAMVIISYHLPQASSSNKGLLIIVNYLFAGAILVMVVNIVSEVRDKL